MKQLIEILQDRDVLLLLCGLIVRLIISKRKFDRRGIGGLQHFSSFWVALTVIVIEWIVKWAANLLILISLINLLIR